MTYALAALALLSALADHWTTWLCLRAPVPGIEIVEANPLSDWIFREFGLVEGLALDTAVTLIAVGLLVRSPLFSPRSKQAALFAVFAVTSIAVANNLKAVRLIGLGLDGLPA